MKSKKQKLIMALCCALAVSAVSAVSVAVGCHIAGSKSNQHSSSEDPVVENDYSAVGVYYAANAEGDEYLLTLSGDAFTLVFGSETVAGAYMYDGAVLTLTEANGTVTVASVVNGVVELTYNGEAYRFVKNSSFTVSYSVDGSVIGTAKVVNGKTVSKPEDPEKGGYHFIGWYLDDAYTVPFAFDATPVTADTTLYAYFVEEIIGADEFTATLVVDGEVYATQKTISGKLYELPTPEKEGAKFAGWWLAWEENKPTAKYADQTLGANAYLYAVWESEAPRVSVNATGITWEDSGINNQYKLTVVAPDETSEDFTANGQVSQAYDFASKAAGEYKITLTKNGNVETTVYYRNKTLEKVSLFTVAEPSVLIFNAVENAEKYIITVDCGNDEHTHQEVDNGKSTYFNFANCDMQDGGISFSVKAVAKDGYASSVSETFYYSRDLDEVTGLSLNADTDTLVWGKVENATAYVVEIVKGEETYSARVEENTYSLKNYSGELTVKVYPVAVGYNSPAATELTYNKTRLASPVNIRYSEQSLVWDEVEGAEKYLVEINGVPYETESASLALTEEQFVEGQDEYVVTVYAIGGSDETKSLASDAYTVRYATLSDTLVYADGVVSWSPVVSAVRYAVKVNDGKEVSVGAATEYKVPFTRAGWNTISVCYYDEDTVDPDWVEIQVYVYEVTFDTLGGASIAKQYKARGDALDLPEAEFTGYDFNGWYNVPGGPASNGAKYENTVFDGTGNVTLYASWKPKAYTVTFVVNTEEGTLEETTATVYYKQPYKLPTATSLDASMVFGGWYSEPNGGGEAYSDIEGSGEEWKYPEDRKLYASWLSVFTYEEATTADGVECYAVMKNDLAIGKVKEITIPAEYNGKPVLIIEANAFKGCSKLVTINIPDTIQTIYLDTKGTASAFLGCSSLQAVNVYCPDEENHATHIVDGSTEHTAYESIDGILICNTGGTRALKYIPSTIKEGKFVVPDGVQTISQGVFSGKNFTEIVIPASVTRIESSAFEDKTKITSIIFEAAAEGEEEQPLYISSNAFEGCSGLKTIELPARLQTVTNDIFTGCKNLTEINIVGNGVGTDKTQIYCSVDGVLFSADKSKIILCPAAKSGEYVIPTSVLEVGDSAFAGCKNITKLTVSPQVALIDSSAFSGCTGLAEIVFEADEYTMTALTIADSAFYGTGLATVTLPANLTNLGRHAFGGISKLKTVYVDCGENLNFENNAFVSTSSNALGSVTDLHLGARVGELEINGVFGSALNNIVVDQNNPYYTAVDGVLFNKDVTKIVCYPAGRTGDYVLPDSVTEIGASVFKGKTNITSITIGKNVTLIGENAFQNCTGLTSVIFEEEGTEALAISDSAFSGCKKLLNVTLPDRLETIGASAFAECDALTAIEIPEGVTTLGDKAFSECDNLRTVKLPSTLTKMGTYNTSGALSTLAVFDGCDLLESIDVAEENTAFADIDGVLYGKNADNELSELYLAPKMKGGVVDIPKTVTKIWAKAFYGNTAVTEIKFSQGLEGSLTFGTDVFVGATKLAKVELPAGITTLGTGMFKNCTALTTINIPYTVTSINAQVFLNCSSLTSVTFDATPEDKTPVALTISNGATGTGAFYGCTSLTEIVLPERLTTIGKYTFENNEKLANVTLPSTLTKIDEKAFFKTGITAVALGDGVTTLGSYAFGSCENLKTLTIGSGLKTLAGYEFNGCSSLTSVTFSDKCALTNISKSMFSGSGLTSIDIPSTVTKINASAFYNCKDLVSVTIPAKTTTIDTSAFSGCGSLSNVTFTPTSTLTTIGTTAFKDCYSLKEITIPASVTTINSQAFQKCRILENITFDVNASGKSALKTVNSKAFDGSGLTSFAFPETTGTLTLKASLFTGCKKLTTVHLSTTVSSVTDVFEGCSSIEKITVAEGSQNFSVDESSPQFLLNADATAIRYSYGTLEGTIKIPDGIEKIDDNAFQGQLYITRVEIPASVREIGEEAFDECANLKSVVFADGSELTTIGKNAFADTALKSIVLPNSLTDLSGGWAFWNCKSLESVTMSNQLTSLGYKTFEGCESLKSIILPDSLTTMGTNIFSDCFALSYVQLPSGLTTLPNNTFTSCTSLKTITLPSGLTSLGGYAFRNSGLESIVVPAGVTSTISTTNVFEGCTNLKSVTFLGELVDIGAALFKDCPSLSDFVIPSTVTYMGDSAFSNTGLTSVHVPALVKTYSYTNASGKAATKTIGATIFNGCKALTAVTIEKGAVLGSKMFYGCTALESVVMEDGVTFYSTYTFSGCKALTSVTLSSDLTAIPANAFEKCTSLTTIDIPDTVESIGTSAFSGSAITSVKIPTAITELGTSSTSSAFKGCTQLAEVIFHDNLTLIGDSAFSGCTSLTSVTIPASVATIGSSAFAESGLETVTFAEGSALTTVGNSAFADCLSLQSIALPASATSLGTKLFQGCSNLTDVSVSDGVVTLAANMFDGCTKLTSIKLPENLETINGSAFLNSGLKSVTLPETLKTINSAAFSGTQLTTIHIPAAVSSIYWTSSAGCSVFLDCDKLTSITVDTANVKYTSVNGLLYNAENMLLCCPKGVSGSVTLPEGATISPYAFKNCDKITMVVLPEDLTKIDKYVFQNCTALEIIEIPDSVTKIETYAFNGCTSLVSLKLGEGLTSIGTYAFQNTKALKNVVLPSSLTTLGTNAFNGSGLESIIIPETLAKIDTYTFQNCEALAEVTLSEGLTTIGSSAFENCYALKEITIPESVTSIGSSAFKVAANTTTSGTQKVSQLETVRILGNPTVGSRAFGSSYDAQYTWSVPTSALKNVYLSDSFTSIGLEMFAGASALETIELPDSLTSIGEKAFQDCVSLKSIEIPEGITTISNYAFSYCESLTSIELPSSLTTMGYCAFEYSGLESIEIPENVKVLEVTVSKTLQSYIFQGCENLSSVEFLGDVTAIGTYTFADCTSLTSIEIPATVKKLGTGAFENTGLTSLVIPDTVRELGSGVVKNCVNLTSCTLPDNYYVTEIPSSMFDGCIGLTSIEIPEKYFKIGSSAFRNTSLTSLKIPGNVYEIGQYAFEGVTTLKSIVLLITVTSVKATAFRGWTAAQTIYFEGNEMDMNIGASDGWVDTWNGECEAVFVMNYKPVQESDKE